MCKSVPQMDVARTLISTSRGPIAGTSFIVKVRPGCRAGLTAARIVSVMVFLNTIILVREAGRHPCAYEIHRQKSGASSGIVVQYKGPQDLRQSAFVLKKRLLLSMGKPSNKDAKIG